MSNDTDGKNAKLGKCLTEVILTTTGYGEKNGGVTLANTEKTTVTEDQLQEDATKILTLPEKLCYGVGHVFNDLCASMWFSYLLIFFEKVGRILFDKIYILIDITNLTSYGACACAKPRT